MAFGGGQAYEGVDQWQQDYSQAQGSWDAGFNMGNAFAGAYEGAGGPSDWSYGSDVGSSIGGVASSGTTSGQSALDWALQNVSDHGAQWMGNAYNFADKAGFLQNTGMKSVFDKYNEYVLDPLHQVMSAGWLVTNPMQDRTWMNLDEAWKAAEHTSPGEALSLNPVSLAMPFPGMTAPDVFGKNQYDMTDKAQHDKAFDGTNIVPGFIDAGVQFFADPAVVAGKGSALFRARYLFRAGEDAGTSIPKIDNALDLAEKGAFDPLLNPHHAEAAAAMGDNMPALLDKIARPAARSSAEGFATETKKLSESILEVGLDQTIDPRRSALSGADNALDALRTTVAEHTGVGKDSLLTDTGWLIDAKSADDAGRIVVDSTIGYRMSQDGYLMKTVLDNTGMPVVKLGEAGPLIQHATDPTKMATVMTSKANTSLLSKLPWLPKGLEMDSAQFLSQATDTTDYIRRKGFLLGSQKAKQQLMESSPVEASAMDAAQQLQAKLQRELEVLKPVTKRVEDPETKIVKEIREPGWKYDTLNGFTTPGKLTIAERAALRRTPEDYDLAFRMINHIKTQFGSKEELFGVANDAAFTSPGMDGGGLLAKTDKFLQKVADITTASNEASRAAAATNMAIRKGNIEWFRPAGMGGAFFGRVSRAMRELPDYYVGTKGTEQVDAPNSVRAILRDFYPRADLNKEFTYADGMTTTGRERAKYLFDEWARRTQLGQSRDLAYHDAARWLDEQLWSDLTRVTGLTKPQQEWVKSHYKTLRRARTSAHQVIDDGKYHASTDPVTGTPLYWVDPVNGSQLSAGFMLMHFGEAREVIGSLAFKEQFAAHVTKGERIADKMGKYGDLGVEAADEIMSLWKAAVLLRPLSYPMRNVGEGLTRWMAVAGGPIRLMAAMTGENGSMTGKAAAERARAAANIVDEEIARVDRLHLENLNAIEPWAQITAKKNARLGAIRDEQAKRSPFAMNKELGSTLDEARELQAELFRLRGKDAATYHIRDDVKTVYGEFSAVHEKALETATGVVPLKSLDMKETTYINPHRVADYADNLENNVGFDQPIKLGLNPDNGEVRLVDGVNRIHAARGTGQTHVPVRVVVDRSGQGALIRKVQKVRLSESLDQPGAIQPEHGAPVFRSGSQVADGTPLDVSTAFTGQRWTGKNVKVWQEQDAQRILDTLKDEGSRTYQMRDQLGKRIDLTQARLDRAEKKAQRMLEALGIVNPDGTVIHGWDNLYDVELPDAQTLTAIAEAINYRTALHLDKVRLMDDVARFEQLGLTKVRRGEGVQSYTDPRTGTTRYYPGMYANTRAGAMVRNAVSGAGTTRLYTSSGKVAGNQRSLEDDAYGQLLNAYKITRNTPVPISEGDTFWKALAEHANAHIGGTPLFRMILARDPLQASTAFPEFQRFLRTREGALIREQFNLSDARQQKKWFNFWSGHANHLFPDPEIRQALARGEKVDWQTLKASKYDLPPDTKVVGTTTELLPTRARWNMAGQVVHQGIARVFNGIGTVPENTFTRFPFANWRYNEHTQRLMGNLGGVPTVAEANNILRVATKAAIQDTRDTLYTTMRKRKVFESMRFVAAFAEAQYNSLQFWARTMIHNPQYLARLAQIVQIPDKMGLVDEEGNLAIPIPGPFTNVLGLKDKGVNNGRITLSKEALFNLYFNVGNQENPILGGLLPGPSPLIGIAASEIAKNPLGQGILKWADEQGGVMKSASKFLMEQLVQQNPSALPMSADRLFAGWMQKAGHELNFAKGNDDTYMASLQLQAWQADHIQWALDGGKGPQPMMTDQKYRDAAESMANLKILTNLISPLGFQIEDKNVALATNVYRKLQQQDPQHADRILIQQYPQFVSILAKPREAAKIGGSIATNDWIRANQSVLRKVAGIDPEAARLLVPYSQPNSFSMYAYRWQEANKIPGTNEHWRQLGKQEQTVANWEYKVGSTLRRIKSDEINAEMARLGITPTNRDGTVSSAYKWYKEQLNQYTSVLEQRYPGFGVGWNDGTNIYKGLHILRTIADDADFARNDPVLVGSIREYQKLRDEAINANGDKQWYWTTNNGNREAFQAKVDEIGARDPIFNRLYNQYLAWNDDMSLYSTGARFEKKKAS